MIIVLSPAKSLDYETPPHTGKHTIPDFLADSAQLIDTLRTLSPPQIGSLMGISDTLAHLNYNRFADWSPPFDASNAKQAALAFNGDVYEGLDAKTLRVDDLDFAQRHLRILSGLYGVLRPLDLMQPYRLEMGTRIANPRGRDLYAFWGERIAATLAAAQRGLRGAAKGDAVLVNLASNEYFRAVSARHLEMPIVTPVFEDWQSGRYKIVSFYAKRARGLMARHAIVNRISNVEQLKDFDAEGYAFDAEASDQATWRFRRRKAA